MREESTCSWTEQKRTLLKCHDCSTTGEGKTCVFLEIELASPSPGGIFSQAKGQRG